MILGLVPLSLRLHSFPLALLYHYASIFAASYFFHCSTSDFASYSIPLSFQSHFPCFLSYSLSVLFTLKVYGTSETLGKTGHLVLVLEQPPKQTSQGIFWNTASVMCIFSVSMARLR